MRAVICRQWMPYQDLPLEEVPSPTLGPGQVRIGTHYAGPSWEAIDGSKVQGEVKARFASSDPQAIPWLLLATRSTGKDGSFAKVTFIQRLETVGGKAPADGCTQAKLNQELRIDYTANYHLYTGKD